MKNIILSILIVACGAFGVAYFVQQDKLQKEAAELAQTKQQLADLQTQLKEKTDEAEAARLSSAKVDILQKTLNESATAAVEQSKKAEALQQSLAESKTNNPMHSIAEMFKDPKMREMMKAQQKAFITLAQLHRDGTTLASVCTGAMLLAAAGLLKNRPATTNHAALEELRAAGAQVISARVVDDGNIVTAGGITCGMDLTLWLVERFAGAEIAHIMEQRLEYERRGTVWKRSP
jgi:transcriptional regulator GlxA family with amidase domain